MQESIGRLEFEAQLQLLVKRLEAVERLSVNNCDDIITHERVLTELMPYQLAAAREPNDAEEWDARLAARSAAREHAQELQAARGVDLVTRADDCVL